MIEEYKKITSVYSEIYNWLAAKTPGENSGISYFKNYDKKAWKIIKEKIIEIEKKRKLTQMDMEFLKCRYQGTAYRIIRFNSRNKGHVFLTDTYQSCSKDMGGIRKVTLYGDRLLIKLNADKSTYAIDVFELLGFMIKNKIIDVSNTKYYNIENLTRYEDEKEVVVPICENTIVDVSVIDSKGKILEKIPHEKWFRKNLY